MMLKEYYNYMEIKNIHKDSDWFASYEECNQSKSLIICQQKKIKQLNSLIETIKGEIELSKNPKEFSSEMILESVNALINNISEVSHVEGYYKWIG
jgi:hypothetical protein